MDADADAGPSCDETKTPDVEDCLVGNRYAIFVSAGASDGDGTKEAPFGTIAEGIAAAKASAATRIIVCSATYPEKVTLTANNAGLSLFGGFTCPSDANGWAYQPEVKPLVQPATGLALQVDGAASRITFQDISFQAAEATPNTGESSIGAIVSGSDVLFRRVNITAGKGASGRNGDPGQPGKAGDPPGDAQNGKAPVCDGTTAAVSGGTQSTASTCTSSGGLGGSASLNAPGASGTSGVPGETANGGAAATQGGLSFEGGAGKSGAAGTDGAPGAQPPSAGTFTSTGFIPASGAEGSPGSAGQGGGGGGASKGADGCTGASGGAGGMGGCGGTGGKGGGGGGASVALISWESTVLLEAVVLTASDGGKGGNGGAGGASGPGKEGGKGGPELNADPQKIAAGGAGGNGGSGGLGGAGSGGTGGPSIALVVHGPDVTRDIDSALAHGTGGVKGARGGTAAPEGSDGIGTQIFEQP